MTDTGLHILVVDDEAPIRDELAYLLEQDDRVETVTIASDGSSALRVLAEIDVDAVFLDIRMPGLTGLEVASILRRYENPPPFVFVSAHDTHAVSAFDLHALDYLLKPIRPDRVREAVGRIAAALDRPTSAARVTDASGGAAPTADAEPVTDRIAVDVAGTTRFVSLDEIRYAEAHGDYARLATPEGRYLVRVPLSTLEEQWAAAGFTRIHRRWLVNLAHVDEVRQENGRLSLVVDGRPLEVSRRHTRAVRDMVVRSARPGKP